MVVGQNGLPGHSVQGLVVMEVRRDVGPVPIPHQSTEESAWGQAFTRNRVSGRDALVCETFVYSQSMIYAVMGITAGAN